MIEIWELKFSADVAVNHQLNKEHIKAIQYAMIKAINENAEHNLLVGETRMTIEPRLNKSEDGTTLRERLGEKV